MEDGPIIIQLFEFMNKLAEHGIPVGRVAYILDQDEAERLMVEVQIAAGEPPKVAYDKVAVLRIGKIAGMTVITGA